MSLTCQTCTYFRYCSIKYKSKSETIACNEYTTEDVYHEKTKSCDNCIFRITKDCRSLSTKQVCNEWHSDVCVCGNLIDPLTKDGWYIRRTCSQSCGNVRKKMTQTEEQKQAENLKRSKATAKRWESYTDKEYNDMVKKLTDNHISKTEKGAAWKNNITTKLRSDPVRKVLSDKATNQWKNMSKEDYIIQMKKRSDTWKSKSKEELGDINQKRRESWTQEKKDEMRRKYDITWANKPEQEKEDIRIYLSEYNKKYWTNLTDEQYQAKIDKIKGWWDRLPKEEQDRISQLHSDIWWNRPEEDRIEIRKTQGIGSKNKWDSLTDEQYKEVCDIKRKDMLKYHASLTDEDKQAINAKISEALQLYYLNMPLEEYNELREKQKPKKEWTLISGKTIVVDSGWEGKMYDLLLYWDVPFDYTREIPWRFKIGEGKQAWFPDFVLADKKIIIEVKGHPQAWEVWSKKLPLIMKSEDLVGWSVIVVDIDPKFIKEDNFDDFLKNYITFTI